MPRTTRQSQLQTARQTGCGRRGGRTGRRQTDRGKSSWNKRTAPTNSDHSEDEDDNFNPNHGSSNETDNQVEEDIHQHNSTQDFNDDNINNITYMQQRQPTRKQPRVDEDTEDTPPLPTMQSYRELGRIWGPARAEEVLANQKFSNNRPSAAGLFEAQGLQSAYNRDKTMLCLVLRCNRSTLDEAL